MGLNPIWLTSLKEEEIRTQKFGDIREEGPCEDPRARRPSTSQGEWTQKKSNPPIAWFWTLSHENCERINFCIYFSPLPSLWRFVSAALANENRENSFRSLNCLRKSRHINFFFKYKNKHRRGLLRKSCIYFHFIYSSNLSNTFAKFIVGSDLIPLLCSGPCLNFIHLLVCSNLHELYWNHS